MNQLSIRAALILAATMATASLGHADGTTPAKPTPAKLTDVTVCPMTMAKGTGTSGGSEVVGKYMVHFCCPGCKPDFDKLSAADKQKKVDAALAKQNAIAAPRP